MFIAHVANHQVLAAADSRLPADHVRTPSELSTPVRTSLAYLTRITDHRSYSVSTVCQPAKTVPHLCAFCRPGCRVRPHAIGQATGPVRTLSARLLSPPARSRPTCRGRPHAISQVARGRPHRVHCLRRVSATPPPPSMRIDRVLCAQGRTRLQPFVTLAECCAHQTASVRNICPPWPSAVRTRPTYSAHFPATPDTVRTITRSCLSFSNIVPCAVHRLRAMHQHKPTVPSCLPTPAYPCADLCRHSLSSPVRMPAARDRTPFWEAYTLA
ncbi:UNVERIFIED_CONTAM: hypothetical protein Sradi_3315600 [Sesamum radiatum]|uniref:Uncharacterized protein n=1 Tax=Sesamum radiatum TaxID=300843 RepID=A0AAW2R2C1_SESRA